MKVEMYIQIPTERLSTYKTNLIEAYLNPLSDPIGQVSDIIEEVGKNVFRCSVSVYEGKQDEVLRAMSSQAKRLADGN
jgi:hypothetical protein